MRLVVASLVFGALATSAFAQSVISAHSGVIHYTEGSVTVQDKAVDMKFGHFPDVKPNEILKTEEGRAEVLLVPGSILRLAENTSVRMIDNHLSSTRVELLRGEIVIESMDFIKDSAAAKTTGNVVTLVYKDSQTTLTKAGLFAFSTAPGRLRVYEGEATVTGPSGALTLKKGKETQLEGALMAEKFDVKAGDELTRWSARRSGYLAAANVAAAKTLSSGGAFSNGIWSSYLGGGYGNGGWAYNPMFGMFTYVPFGGIAYSPFGYSFWSPYTVSQYYNPIYYGNSSAGSGLGATRAIVNPGGNTASLAARTARTVTRGVSFASAAPSAARGSAAESRGGFAPAPLPAATSGNAGFATAGSASSVSSASSAGRSVSGGAARGR